MDAPMDSSSHPAKLSSHDITASNNFRTKLTHSSDHFADMPTKPQFVFDKKGDTILVPTKFDSPAHAFHEDVLTWCKIPQSVQKLVLLQVNSLRMEEHRNSLSQKEFLDNTSLDGIDLPSTQVGVNAEVDDPPSFEVCLNNQKTFERLIDDKHPWKRITDFQIEELGKRRIRRVKVEWWEKDSASNRHSTSWVTLTDWMKGSKEREALVDCLATNHAKAIWEEMIGSCNWKKLNSILESNSSSESESEWESNAAQSSTQSNNQIFAKQTATGVSPIGNKKPAGKKGDRFLLGGKKRTPKRRRFE